MFKWILAAVVLLSSFVAPAQTTRNFPALDTNNVFLARNSFPWVNNTLYAGSSLYPTIQSAITTACSIGTPFNVTVVVGTNSGTSIPALTGCTTVNVTDLRGAIPLYCTYTTSYACVTGGGGGGGSGPGTPGGTLQVANFGATALVSSGVKQANQFDTGGGGNGIVNAFGSTPNQLVVVNNGETDTSALGSPDGSTILDQRTVGGLWSTRWTNCSFNPGGYPFLSGASGFLVQAQTPCNSLINYQTVSPGHGGGGPTTLSSVSYAEGYGYDVGTNKDLLSADQLWSGSSNLQVSNLSFAPGITNFFDLTGYCHKIGDCNALELSVFSDSGLTGGSDQGLTVIGVNAGESPNILTTTVATTTGTGDTKPTWGTLNGAGYFTPGLWAVNTSHVIASGTITTPASQYYSTGITLTGVNTNGSGQTPGTYPLICSGGTGTGFTGTAVVNPDGGSNNNPIILTSGSGYSMAGVTCTIASGGTPASFFGIGLTTLWSQPVVGTLTPSTALGIVQTYIARSTVDNVNDTVPVVVAVTGGTSGTGFAAGQVLWIASDPTPEMCKVITAGAVVSNSQNLTVSCHLPHPAFSVAFQGGTNGVECFNADATLGWPSCQFAYGATDSTHEVVGFLREGTQVNGALPNVGAQKETFTAPNNGITFYKMATILTTDKYSYGSLPNLNVNDVPWTAGDAVMVPHTAFAVGGISLALEAFTAQNGAGDGGLGIPVKGYHISKGFVPIAIQVQNPYGWYKGCDSTSTLLSGCLPVTGTEGWLEPISTFSVFGPYRIAFDLNPPITNGSLIHVNDSGTTPIYCAICTNSGNAGSLSIDQPNHRFDFGSNLLVEGNLTTSSSLAVAGGIQTGQGIIIGASGGLSLTPPAVLINQHYIAAGVSFANGLFWAINGSSQTASVTWNINSGPTYEMYFQVDNSGGIPLTLHSNGSGVFTSTFSGALAVGGSITSAGNAVCLATGSGCPALPFSFTTTANASDVIALTGMTASGHCSIFPTNATAGTMVQNATPVFIDTFTTNALTVHHVATAGATFSGICTIN